MAHEALVEHCLEVLSPLGPVRARRMFGGHGLYLDGLFVGIIAFNRLYLKTDAMSQPQFAAAGAEPFVYEAKGKPVTISSYWSAPAEAMDSPALMAPWARLALQAALAAGTKVKSRPRPAARPASAKRS